VDKISQFKFQVEDGAKKHLRDVQAIARRAKRDTGFDVLMVDYLTLLEGDGDNRTAQVGYVSRGLKSIARELKVPVLVAAQLNREVEKRQDKRPQLADLRDSGEIEQDADLVWGLYRDDMYNENTERPNQTDVLLLKHRNGPTGCATLYYRKERTQFNNLRKTDVDLAGYSQDYDTRKLAVPREADAD
jgi:replicative DNA helicase